MDKIGVLSCGIGNTFSVVNSLSKINIYPEIVNNIKSLNNIQKLILPGVGSFDACMETLQISRLDEAIKDYVNSEKLSILGICAGMQILFDKSEEGKSKGLSLLKGNVVSLRSKCLKEQRIPHISIKAINNLHSFNGGKYSKVVRDKEYIYFTHSYAVVDTIENADIGYTFLDKTSFIGMIKKNNIWGIQGHPEKSHDAGSRILKMFVDS